VSLLSPKPVIVALAPKEGAQGAEPWTAAVQDLAARELRGRVTVVLSNHFVRYALVPWSAELAGSAEEDAYVRHHFVRIYGERAKAWTFRASPAPAGAARLASAIDANLLAALKSAFARKRAKLASVQPGLMAVFNRARSAVPAGGAWLVLAEPDRACVALHSGGRWQAVSNARGEWLALLERERHRVGATAPDLVLFHTTGPAANDAPGWKIKALAA